MKIVNMYDVKIYLLKLVDVVVNGEFFVIVWVGCLFVRVLFVEVLVQWCIGFLKGQVDVLEDFDDMVVDEICVLFEGESLVL